MNALMSFVSVVVVMMSASAIPAGDQDTAIKHETDLVSSASSSDNGRQQVTIPARLAPVYGVDTVSSEATGTAALPVYVPLGELGTNAVGTQIGITTYDIQHNCTMGRQVEHRGTNFLHFDWTKQTDMILGGNRRIGYQAYNLQTCTPVFAAGGITVNDNYAGFVTMDVNTTNCPIPAGHEANYPRAYWNTCPGNVPSSTFGSDYPTDRFGWYLNQGTGPNNYNLWPKIDWQIGTETVLHMVTAESGGATGQAQTISYYRRVGPYGTGQGVWSAQKVIDTVMSVSPTVVASTTTDKVAIVWVAPADYKRGNPDEYDSQYENDVWYALSNDQGASWMTGSGSIAHRIILGSIPGGNITNYSISSPWKAYCDLSALISTDNNLHVVWNCRRWTDTSAIYRRESAIFHWSQDNPCIRPVAIADWDTGGACHVPGWGSDVTKMSLSECAGKMYVLYTQFGNAQQPCWDYDAAKNILNGELYITGSIDHGYSWDTPQNLTNSPSPNCASGDCESDYWASMSRYGRVETCNGHAGQDVLDILYINDRAPGASAQAISGIWTTNPVMWLSTPCYQPSIFRDLTADPASIGYSLVASGSVMDTSIVLVNNGNDDAIIAAGVHYLSGDGWVLQNQPSSNTVHTGCGHPVTVAIAVLPPDVEGVYEADLLYTYDNGRAVDTVVVPIRLTSSRLQFVAHSSIIGEVNQIAAADLDRDNNVDLIFSSYELQHGLWVAYGLGGGLFAPRQYLSPRSNFTYGFIDSDTLLDIVVADSLTIENLLNDGDRTFTSHIQTYTGFHAISLCMSTGYFNSDVNTDIVVGPYKVFFGNGAGQFYGSGTLPVGLFSAATGDFNEDGFDDIAGVSTDSAYILLNDRHGVFTSATSFPTLSTSFTATTGNALADFNHDGHLDFACVSSGYTGDDSSIVYVALGDGQGGLISVNTFNIPTDFSPQLLTTDFNRDRNLDLAFADAYTPRIIVCPGLGTGQFTGPLFAEIEEPYYIAALAAGDFDRDGNPDIVTGPWYGEDHLTVFINLLPDAPVLADEMTTTGYSNVSVSVQNPDTFMISRQVMTVGGSAYWRYLANEDTLLDAAAVDYNLMYGEYRIALTALPTTLPGDEFSAIIKIDGTDQIRLFINYDLPFSKQGIDGRLTADTIVFYYMVEPVSSIQPPNGREATTNPPTFDWSRLVAGIAADSFHLQLDRFYDFHGAPMVADTGGLTTPVFTPGSPLGADSVFYWRFRSFVGGVWSDYSRTFAVYISGYTPGDANGDKVVNIGDAVYIVNYVFRGGPAPNPIAAADANCDGQVNIGDAVYLVNYIFRGGPAPCGG